jgi:molybdenum cofactor biosynthesis protein B
MKAKADVPFVPLNIAVLTVSDTRTVETDTSGQLFVDRLSAAGHGLYARALLEDDLYKIRAQVAQWIADDQCQVVLITGGTGFTGRDSTPEAVSCLLDKQVDGFGELFRQISVADIGTSTVQSRALAGLANGTLVCCLPHRLGWHPCRAVGRPPPPLQLRRAPQAGRALRQSWLSCRRRSRCYR